MLNSFSNGKRKMVKIVLNMIVKNESMIIERCLSSVVPIIDFFVIMDTGSTDNTVDVIKNFFSGSGIKGMIIKGEFRNFSQARNQSLVVASMKSGCDYILLMDADMVLRVGSFDKKKIDTEIGSYYMIQCDKRLEYKNTRLVKNNSDYYYKGYTHEVLFSRESDKRKTFSKDIIYIEDISDGGCKKNKTERDERLLLLEIQENPENSRPYFYLANTYFSRKEYDKAATYYAKRIMCGGWKEELWYSYYKLSSIKLLQNKIPEAIYLLLVCIEVHPKRPETYIHLVALLKDNKMHLIHDMIMDKAISIYQEDNDTSEYLFYEKVFCENEFKKMILEQKNGRIL